MYNPISTFFLLFICVSVINGGVISDFLSSFGRRTVEVPGLCPFIRRLEPQDYLRHRSISVEGRSLDEDPVPDDSSRVATIGDSSQKINEKPKDDEDFENEPKDSLCGTVCTSDKECGKGKKCCPTTCGYACYDPVFMIDDVLNNLHRQY